VPCKLRFPKLNVALGETYLSAHCLWTI